MSKRFGRNQRRKLRESEQRKAELEARVTKLITEVANLRYNGDQVMSEALMRFLADTGRLDTAIKIMSAEMGRALGAKLRPHAEKLLQASQHRKPLLSFKWIEHPDINEQRTIQYIQADISSLHYRCAIDY